MVMISQLMRFGPGSFFCRASNLEVGGIDFLIMTKWASLWPCELLKQLTAAKQLRVVANLRRLLLCDSKTSSSCPPTGATCGRESGFTGRLGCKMLDPFSPTDRLSNSLSLQGRTAALVSLNCATA